MKNPVLVARKVMEETDHVMLAGEGAQRFARVMGFPDHDPVTPARRADWQDKRKRVDEVLGKHSLKMRRFLKEHPEYAGGTVGASAVDVSGVLAAATSTGGVTLKLVGRVGDSPIAGRRQLRVAVRRRLRDRHRRVRDALARHARDLGSGRARRHARQRDEGRPRPARARLRSRRGHHRRGQRRHPVAQHLTRDMPHAFFSGEAEVVSRMRVCVPAHKIPVSTLVVIHTPELQVLLLERADHPGFWQSVTGSQHEGEALRDTAIREVGEETGLDAARYPARGVELAERLRNLSCVAPPFRARSHAQYGARVRARGSRAAAGEGGPREHLAALWLPWDEAAERVFSWSNRKAILMLPERKRV